MNKSESIVNLSKALAAAQGEMPAIKFDSTNPFLKNKFASLGAVIDGTRPILAKHGLSVTHFPFGEGGVIGVEVILMHNSGEWISNSVSMEIGEEKGKSSAQVAGSIITYLRRYTLASILGVYSDEDGDGHSPAQTPREKRAVEREREEQADVQVQGDPMTIERAMKIENSEGVKYGDLANDKLQAMVLGINKGLKSELDDEKRAEYLEKKQAIGVILKARANKEI
jgi:hypothetical protein